MKLSTIQRCSWVPPSPAATVNHHFILQSWCFSQFDFFFTDIQKKQPDDDCAPKASSSSSSSQADIFCNETNSSISQSLMSMPNTSEDPSPGETGASSLPAQDGKTSVDHSEMNVISFLLSSDGVGPGPLYYFGWVTCLGPQFINRYIFTPFCFEPVKSAALPHWSVELTGYAMCA